MREMSCLAPEKLGLQKQDEVDRRRSKRQTDGRGGRRGEQKEPRASFFSSPEVEGYRRNGILNTTLLIWVII